MTSKLRIAMWSMAIGVIAVVLAGVLFRLAPAHSAIFMILLIFSIALLSGLAAAVAELPPMAGAGAGVFAAALVAIILGLTIAVAPVAPGGQRPGFADLLWLPLFGLIAALAVCGAAGWAGIRTGLRLSRRRTPPV
jgi:hypothetical protein